MNLRNVLVVVALGVVVVLGARHSRDPRITELPFGSTDLSSVQAQLAKLPDEERALVESYVKRTHGDYLPAGMGDPDNPMTARTFAEAIALEQAWKVKMQGEQAQADARQAERDARLAPLRALVDARVVKAEVLSSAQFAARRGQPQPGQATMRSEGETFVVRIRVQNIGNETLASMTGSLKARDRDEYLPLDLCWIDFSQHAPIAPGASEEIECGGRAGVSDQQRAFATGAPGRFTVVWEPREVVLASGRRVEAGVY